MCIRDRILDIERGEKIDLPNDVIGVAVDDDNVDNIDDLPGSETGVTGVVDNVDDIVTLSLIHILIMCLYTFISIRILI